MKAESRFMVEVEEFAWGTARERERANRGKVCVLLGKGGRVVCRRRKSVTLEPVNAAMVGVLRYDVEDAAGAAGALGAIGGKQLVPLDVYEFAKARQYCARAVLVKMAAAGGSS